MDNLTHTLVGLAAAKAGLERTSPHATAVCVLAANAPDMDIIALLGGRFFYLEQHRGITHSIVGTLALALLLPAFFYGAERLLAILRKRQPRARFKGLLISSLILSASHPLLDWTNSYGVRPLLPWDSHWIYGDLVFILDPWIWLAVGGAAFLLTARTKWRIAAWGTLALVLTAAILLLPRPGGMDIPRAARALWLAGLAGIFLLHRLRLASRFGAAIPSVALALVVVYWGALALLHARALARAGVVAQSIAARMDEHVVRVAAMPMPADPTRWLCVAETERATTRFELSLNGAVADDYPRNAVRLEKPQGEARELVARASEDARAGVFLNFARFPVTAIQGGCVGDTLVQFADLRFTQPGERGTFTLEVPLEGR
ncbi:MAG: metal-dependent hydrolase [Acidobacteria bacterium]|nr:metal-dependent hydrolase [Acidobacteriota bacterium]